MKYKTYTVEQIEEVKKLYKEGVSQSEIARRLSISRNTLKCWVLPSKNKTGKIRNSYVPILDFDQYLNTKEKRSAYSFVLAVYLCDGYIANFKYQRAPSLRFFNDSKYEINTEEWREKLSIVLPDIRVTTHKKKCSNCLVVLAYSRKLVDLFPQHGLGKKHDRLILLADWQKQIISEFPEQFIRGCIQSDGTIYTHKVRNFHYKAYAFTNMSEGIIDIFLYALSCVGIHKEKWQNKTNKKFVVQNFKKGHIAILERIISKKE